MRKNEKKTRICINTMYKTDSETLASFINCHETTMKMAPSTKLSLSQAHVSKISMWRRVLISSGELERIPNVYTHPQDPFTRNRGVNS